MSSDTKLLAHYYATRWSAKLEFNPHDLWVGVYWQGRTVASRPCLDVYLCLLPALPIHIFLALRKRT